MVEAFRDEQRGFGLPISDSDLQKVNEDRLQLGRPVLEESLGLRHLVFGKSKHGLWTFKEFEE